MAHVSATERQGAARVGRWAGRALIVLGGVAAGTAAAWAISGSAASAAEPITVLPAGASANLTPVTDATVGGLSDATHGVSRFVGEVSATASGALNEAACHQDATTWSIPAWCGEAARGQIGGPLRQHGQHGTHRVLEHEVADRVSDAVTDLTDDAVVHPIGRTLGAFEHIVRKPEDAQRVLGETLTPSAQDQDFGKKIWQLLGHDGTDGLLPLPALPVFPGLTAEHGVTPAAVDPGLAGAAPQIFTVTVPAGAQGARFAPGHAVEPAVNADASGVSRGTQGDRPVPAPFEPQPIAPLSVPAGPGGGSAPGGHLDGPTFGIPAGASAAYTNAKAGTVRAGVRYMPLTPGSQPGVTPD